MYDYAKLKSELEFLSKRYEICCLSSIGNTLCGRNIPLIKIGKGTKAVLYAGAFHGLEWITSALLVHFCRRVCQAQESGLTIYNIPVRPLLEKITLYCVPMVNPDGVEISINGSESAGEYAKFSLGKSSRWQANARGVDINHNFNAEWYQLHQIEQNSGITQPGPTRYGGHHPESEPESFALADLCRKIPFSMAIAFHSQGEEIYWQYGEHTPEISYELCKIFSEICGYRVSKPQELISSMGGFKDWFIDCFRRPAFTFEIGKGKNPLPIAQLPQIEGKLFPVMIRAMQEAVSINL